MYPDFQFLIKEWFGINIPALSLFKTFGFMVALAFLAAAYTLYLELKRKEEEGLITSFTIKEKIIGKRLAISDYFISGFFGFLVGFKVSGLFMNISETSHDPLGYILSMRGNIFFGIIIMILVLLNNFYLDQKNKNQSPTTKKVKILPHMRVGDMAVLAAVSGFVGAKIFNALESFDGSLQHTFQSLFSSMGFTFYGGLIVAVIAFYFYAKKFQIPFKHLCDAAAPGLILAYGIGRLGCQVAGDGDWGVYNSAYSIAENNKIVLSQKGELDSFIKANPQQFISMQKEYGEIPSAHFSSSFLPTWLQAFSYAHNVNNEGLAIKNCDGDYCRQLAWPVFPTPLYECILSVLIFIFLWFIRRKSKIPLTIFSVYLILNGLERFFIEKIRVNYKYDFNGFRITQAEIISFVLILIGIIIFFMRKKIDAKKKNSNLINT